VSSSSEDINEGSVTLTVSSYLDDGFVVTYSGVSEPTYVKFSYMAI